MQTHTILVVDDEPASLRTLSRTLRGEYRVATASSAAEALRLLPQQPVSMIITDHRMPGMTGVELLARTRDAYPDVVRIVLTGYTDADALIEAINSGEVFYYLTKPWEPRDLRLAVRRGIERLEAQRERQKLQRELEHACSRAVAESARRKRLLTTAAHELGTPIHLMGNALELLAAVPAAGESQWLAMAQRGVAWLRRSLAQIRVGVCLQERQVRLDPCRTDVTHGLRLVTSGVRAAIVNRDVALMLVADTGLFACADQAWLYQLWIALLSNAVRFTLDGGSVRVVARRVGDAVEVRVCDTGVGMTAEQLAVVFEPFSHAGGDVLLHTSGLFEAGSRGLGLGLSIARSIVELHRGSIEMESEAGRGTCCTVRLPIDRPGDSPRGLRRGRE